MQRLKILPVLETLILIASLFYIFAHSNLLYGQVGLVTKNQNNPWDKRTYLSIAKTQLIEKACIGYFLNYNTSLDIIFCYWSVYNANLHWYGRFVVLEVSGKVATRIEVPVLSRISVFALVLIEKVT